MYRLSLDNIKGYAVDVYKLPPNIWGEGNTLSEIGRIIQYCKYRKLVDTKRDPYANKKGKVAQNIRE